MSESMYTLAIHSSVETGAVRLFDAEIQARATDLRYTTRIDGGYEGLEVGLRTDGFPTVGELQTPIDLPYRAHVELWDGDALLWEGRAGYREIGNGGRVKGFVAHGYMSALGDDWVRDNTDTAITGGAALQYAIETYAPYLSIGSAEQFILPTVSISRGLAALYKTSPALVAEIVMRLGNASQELMDVQVWDNRTVWMRPRTVPQGGAQYRVPLDERYVHWSEDPSEMASEVTVEYSVTVQGEGGSVDFPATSAAENTEFLDTWGFQRKIILSVGEASASEAEALRDRELRTRSQPIVQATISLSRDAGTLDLLMTRGGVPRPWTLVRSGEWVEVAGKPDQPIVGTTADLTGGSATFELGAPDPLMPKNADRTANTIFNRLAKGLDIYYGRRR